MATIQLVDVSKRFAQDRQRVTSHSTRRQPQVSGDDTHIAADGPVCALNGVNLTIPHGQTMVIVGPSGCGKSTLLRTVAGLEREYSGEIFYDERPMAEVPAGERHIGMVFQNYALYPHFEGHGNLSFFFRLRKSTDAETEERIRITSEIMGFGFRQLLARKPGTLSGGQQQRLAIGRAIVRNPKLFLFDEPLSNLDAKLRMQTRVEIKRLLQRFGITALYVTHDQVEAMALSDQVAVMRAGRVEQVGSFQSLVKRPANLFVAGFLGVPPMNLFAAGEVVDGRLALPTLPSSSALPLPAPLQEQCHPGQRITVGIRPEHLWVQTTQTSTEASVSATTNLLHGVVEMAEPDFGRQVQLIHIRVGEGVAAQTLTAQASIHEPIFAGHPATVAIQTEHCYFFDDASGHCLLAPA